MVVWLFLGGGESEIRGLVPFLAKHFRHCQFQRVTPAIRKPGPRPGVLLPGYGKTGPSLVVEIKERLKNKFAYGEECDLILVVDDLDCRDEVQQREKFALAINAIEGSEKIDKLIGFSSPELESWILADWDNSLARHPDFRGRQERMRHWLSHEKKIAFDDPESFGVYDEPRDCCDLKLSEALIAASMTVEEDRLFPRYSKGRHTPVLLQEINPGRVMKKCPMFKRLFAMLLRYDGAES